jgi:hypothetical protein
MRTNLQNAELLSRQQSQVSFSAKIRKVNKETSFLRNFINLSNFQG